MAGLEITEESIDRALEYLGRVTIEYQSLLQVVGKADPQPVSHANLNPAFFLWIVPVKYVKEAYDGLSALTREAEKRVGEGIGVVPKGAPKVFVGIRWVVDHTVIRIIEESGLSISVMTRAEAPR